MTELDALMKELTGLEDLSEEEKLNESEGKKNKKSEQYRAKALDMRNKVIGNHSETTSKKPQEENQPKKKVSSVTIGYLKALRREKLELKKKEQAEKSKIGEEAAKGQQDRIR